MIEVSYNAKKNRITIKGHANSGEIGHDLICAAVSALTYTLATNVVHMHKIGNIKTKTIKLEQGDALIRCTPVKEFKSVISVIFDSICVGFEILAKEYPDNIKFSLV